MLGPPRGGGRAGTSGVRVGSRTAECLIQLYCGSALAFMRLSPDLQVYVVHPAVEGLKHIKLPAEHQDDVNKFYTTDALGGACMYVFFGGGGVDDSQGCVCHWHTVCVCVGVYDGCGANSHLLQLQVSYSSGCSS